MAGNRFVPPMLLNLNKPPGMITQRVLDTIKRILQEGRSQSPPPIHASKLTTTTTTTTMLSAREQLRLAEQEFYQTENRTTALTRRRSQAAGGSGSYEAVPTTGKKYATPKERGEHRNQNFRVGQGGTLDPLAYGVLIVGVHRPANVRLSSLLQTDKGYLFEAKLGEATSTQDAAGQVTTTAPYDHVTASLIEEHLQAFRGTIEQVPPMYSALKRNGRRLYELARKDVQVAVAPRPVRIYEIRLCAFDPPFFQLYARVSAGTYVRTLAHDLAIKMGTFAHVTSLGRLHQGPFSLADALPLSDWTLDNFLKHSLSPHDFDRRMKQYEQDTLQHHASHTLDISSRFSSPTFDLYPSIPPSFSAPSNRTHL